MPKWNTKIKEDIPVELSDLKIFYEVARFESISHAANKLGYVQSNVSKRIKVLEKELNTILFTRNNRGMKLTCEGEILKKHTENILISLTILKAELKGQEEIIKIGATQTISINYLQSLFLEKTYDCYTFNQQELLEKLIYKEVDVIITNQVVSEDEFKSKILLDEAVFWTKHQSASSSLNQANIIVNRQLDCPYRKATLNYLKKHQITDFTLIEVDTLELLITGIEKYQALSMLPEIMLEDRPSLENFGTKINVPVHLYYLKTLQKNLNIEQLKNLIIKK